MRVYVASKAKHAAWWQALRSAGLDIVATWIDWPHNHDRTEPSAADWSDHWQKCIQQASSCDVFLLHAMEDEVQRGALVELGAALATGRKVFIVSPYDWSWNNHPNVAVFKTLSDAVGALAGKVGKKTLTKPREQP
jgi:hypothetical protein